MQNYVKHSSELSAQIDWEFVLSGHWRTSTTMVVYQWMSSVLLCTLLKWPNLVRRCRQSFQLTSFLQRTAQQSVGHRCWLLLTWTHLERLPRQVQRLTLKYCR